MTIDFEDVTTAISDLRNALGDRVKETQLISDARVQIAAQAITSDELRILRVLSQLDPSHAKDLSIGGDAILSFPNQRGLDGLISKGCVRSAAENTKTQGIYYALTTFGFALAEFARSNLKQFTPEEPASEEGEDASDEQA